MQKIHITASRSYDVLVGQGLLSKSGAWLKEILPKAKTVLLCSEDRVYPLYGEQVKAYLTEAGFQVETFVFSAGEGSKTPATCLELVNTMAQCQLTRTDCAVALGGGVVGDLCGFAASVYLRGIPFVQIPTTLLSAVDASVGGKTAVDLPAGKNLMGSFYQPCGVLCDTDTFRTLSKEVFSDGCAEVIKYAMLGDQELFQLLESGGLTEDLVSVVAKCIADKGEFVQADEQDTGVRMKLNFGHTLAHAIEARSGYEISHGRAVSMGMALVTCAAAKKDPSLEPRYQRLLALLQQCGLREVCPYPVEELLSYLASDKKRTGEMLTLILPTLTGCDTVKMPLAQAQAFFKAE